MTIYSIIPLEVIFAGMEQQTFDYEEVTIYGVFMQVERVDMRHAKIVRLLSNCPNDYLNPALTPGTIIRYQPTAIL